MTEHTDRPTSEARRDNLAALNTDDHVCRVQVVYGKADRYRARCEVCGPVGNAQDFENDAFAIAQRHELVQGFER